ncbi:MAG: BMP family ABC transporter substrate-binding protein, partial [Oscillospiraceae bacterium]
MKKALALVLALVLVFSLAACGGEKAPAKDDTQTDTSAETHTGEPQKIVVVLPNVRGDGGTHDLACRAAEAIVAKSGAELKIVELGKAVTDAAKWEAALCDLAEEGYDLIVTGGSLMKDTIQTVAPMYPDMPFICYDVALDFDSVKMPNVYAMDFSQNEAAYMAGVVAASTSTSGYIGFVGATKIPVIYDFMVGYIAGAKAVNPDIKVATAFTNDFNDAALAKELSLAQIKAGVDVIFPACGNAAAGVYEAARDSKIHAIGNDQDVATKYSTTDPEITNIIAASVMKKVDNAVASAYERYVAGTLPFGSQETVGVAVDGAGMVKNDFYDKSLTKEVKDVIAEYEGNI